MTKWSTCFAKTGALRTGHFAYPNGLHSEDYLQVALAMRYYQHAKVFSVGLSRKLRANSELRAMIPELSDCHAGNRGAPGRLRCVRSACAPIRSIGPSARCRGSRCAFGSSWNQHKGEKVLLVDDILRTGNKMQELKKLAEEAGAEVVGLAVMIYQPTPKTPKFRSAAAVLSGEFGQSILQRCGFL